MAKHDYHWTFGYGVHISFPGGGAPVNQPNHAFSSNEGCATYSDTNGNLLFYTEGQRLYDAANNIIPAPPLGGTSSSAHAAIIVPPAGGGKLYHILTTGEWDSAGTIGPLTHTSVKVSPGTPPGVAIVAGPTKLTGFGPKRAAEKLAAIPHVDCNKYWVVSLDVAAGSGPLSGPGTFYSMLIDSDAGPTPGSNTFSQPYPYPVATHGYCTKFSPDGKLLAVASATSIDILNFDRSTGAVTRHSQIDQIPDPDRPYGVEFSPNGLYLYFTGLSSGYIRRHTIGLSQSPPTTPFSSTSPIAVWPTPSGLAGNYKVGSLQLAPNGKIYGTKVGQTSLFEIGLPDSLNASNVGFNMVATTSGGGPLTLTAKTSLGLPTFTRIADDCADNCRNLAALVDQQIAQTPKVNTLRPCDKSQPVEKPPCAPLDLPRIAPWTSIRWGDSKCDCIEGDDTEVMHLTVCNPYRNLTLSNLTIHQLLVVDMNGNPPPLLPDGSPSIQLVPVGPYCFDDLEPCTCVTRQFVLRLRGAVPGPYRILVRGICFEACFHGDEEDCFIFHVCKD